MTRNPADWQPYNPNAERDARIEAEGVYYEPIQHMIVIDDVHEEQELSTPEHDIDL